jgi:hypothetical protein
MKKLENAPIKHRYGPIVPLTPGLEQDIEYYLMEQTGMPEPRIHALIEKMRTVIGVRDLCELMLFSRVDMSLPEGDPTKRASIPPHEAFMTLIIYILENR